MGAGANKVLLPLAGRPVLAWTLQGLLAHPDFGPCVLVIHRDDAGEMGEMLERYRWTDRVRLVEGGDERIDSVWNGLQALASEDCQWVAVHDGARPLFTPALLSRCIQKVRQYRSAVAAVPVKDTIKQAADDGKVFATPERSGLYAVQTPQVFAYDELTRAYAAWYDSGARHTGPLPTDDAMVMEQAGHPVYLVEGDYENLKLTTPDDLVLAEAILARRGVKAPGQANSVESLASREAAAAAGNSVSTPAGTSAVSTPGASPASPSGTDVRTGMGYDVHRLVEGRALILGGVDIPYEKGLLGHSDADVLLHAIKDALLGAAGMGDIGRHFPDTDQAYKGVSSLLLLKIVGEKLAAQGWSVGHIDATVVAQRPKLAPHIPKMQENIARTLGIAPDRINVKATTTEGLGFAGTGEGIASYAVATIRR
ncbi:2-C-methyl-D-erythritol 2,4-cyclodiphosphate synthase [Heliobacterium undosum]|uniref:Bifunctional enzyme IspD/IspF n=2 Tax=Heliomicrobium undosum TaxID=121734 RepID=A0A845L6D6_9FIRM|nr:2-C-methyl-D-erythritol 2,4-cyclodiphosphate synthase [Heliomicrobium undosum]